MKLSIRLKKQREVQQNTINYREEWKKVIFRKREWMQDMKLGESYMKHVLYIKSVNPEGALLNR